MWEGDSVETHDFPGAVWGGQLGGVVKSTRRGGHRDRITEVTSGGPTVLSRVIIKPYITHITHVAA